MELHTSLKRLQNQLTICSELGNDDIKKPNDKSINQRESVEHILEVAH